MAEPVSEVGRVADLKPVAGEEETPAEVAGRRRERRPAPPPVKHAARFHFFTGALVFLAVAAIALAFVFVVAPRERTATGTPWSAFHPSSDGLDTGTREIAAHVGGQYRLPTGAQIVAVTGGPLQIQGRPVRIAIRESPADGGRIRLKEGRGVQYLLCGLSEKCAIPGRATAERMMLLQREALELALYSFHDLKDVKHVVVYLPPSKQGDEPETALLFGRDDVAGQLARPLRATLPLPVPNPDTVSTAPSTPFVRQLMIGNLFKFSFVEANQDATVFLVLDPPPPS